MPRLAAALALSAALASPAAAEAPAEAGANHGGPTPKRLVSLVPSITETLFALGIGDRVVGVSTSCDFPPSVAALPKVGTFTAPVAEAIVALAPDLVLTSPSPGNQSAVRALQRAGIRVAVVYTDGGIEEARQGMLGVAAEAGEAEKGRALVAAIDAQLSAVKAAVAGRSRPRVAVAVGREPLILAGPASYLGELLVLAGGANIADGAGGRWPQVGMEYLVQQAPEVLLDLSVSMGEGGSPAPQQAEEARIQLVQSWAKLPSVPAVAKGRVYGEADSVLLRPGPRLGEAARLLAGRLHPGVEIGK